MKKDDSKIWLNEFSQFLSVEPIAPPQQVSDRILANINVELNPNPWKVFTKAGFIQVIVGASTLLFCPQFGMSLTGVHGIMHFFMQYGDGVCMFACGTLFAGSSLLVSSLVLSSDEIRVFRRNRTLQVALLSLLTMGAFLCLGAEVWEVVTIAWLAGYLLGGVVSLELGWAARRWVRTKVMYG